MAHSKTCDHCGQETDRIVAKVLMIPVTNGGGKWKTGSYTGHADIGVCCEEKLVKGEIVKWTARKKKQPAS